MNQKSELGKLGEDLAAEYFKKLGWKILDRNVRLGGDELDLVVQDKNKILVLIEVKTMYAAPKSKTGSWLIPEDQLTRAKLTKFRRAALRYISFHPELISKNGFRLDVLAIEVGESKPIFRYYENV
jgi:putative endonuclease